MIALALGTAAITGLVMYRSGIGPPTVLPPFEYATTGAPGAGRSVFGLAGTAITGLLGFHPADVTSRLLALWPLCILATFVFLGRAWSKRAMLVAALAITPFVALLTLQIVGSPRNPPFALTWTATAIPMLAIGVGRALSLQPRWSKVRLVGLLAVAVLLVAAVDQNRRVQPESRFDVAPVVDHVAAQAGAGDVVVYAPDILGDLVTQRAHDAEAISTSDASEVRLADARRVFVFGAFAFNGDDASLQRALGLVKALSARRPLTSEWQHGEAKVWTFE
ncbi:MAG TPA: hypothetical protein VGQ20_03260 [Acidimicrobiales bacterium]|nr:hypothetical protein [Acidimicrobiales bacterium]